MYTNSIKMGFEKQMLWKKTWILFKHKKGDKVQLVPHACATFFWLSCTCYLYYYVAIPFLRNVWWCHLKFNPHCCIFQDTRPVFASEVLTMKTTILEGHSYQIDSGHVHGSAWQKGGANWRQGPDSFVWTALYSMFNITKIKHL